MELRSYFHCRERACRNSDRFLANIGPSPVFLLVKGAGRVRKITFDCAASKRICLPEIGRRLIEQHKGDRMASNEPLVKRIAAATKLDVVFGAIFRPSRGNEKCVHASEMT